MTTSPILEKTKILFLNKLLKYDVEWKKKMVQENNNFLKDKVA